MKTILKFIVVFLYTIASSHASSSNSSLEDGRLNFTELAFKYRQPAEEHEVITEDGYILGLFHIPGTRKTPVLLMHGLLDSADTFVLRGNTSLAISLANAGHDVWAGNIRGNKYSRRHVKLSDKDPEFWDFSFHESGCYDLAAMIDYIQQVTGAKKIQNIGYSQGTTMHFALLSKRPKYNEKISLFIALAPSVFFHDIIPVMRFYAELSPVIDKSLESLGMNEVFAEKSILISLLRLVCRQDLIGYWFCLSGVFFQVAGADASRFEPSFLKVAVGHFPLTGSRKCFLHYAQLMQSKKFCEFDYGAKKNKKRYGSVEPPNYELNKIDTNIALIVGRNDPFASLKNVDILRKVLSNVAFYHVMEDKIWNHLDFVWGNDMTVTLFPIIFKLLDKHE